MYENPYAYYVSHHFFSMRRVEDDDKWTLFCPSDVPQLVTLHGAAFREAYVALEREGVGMKTVRARDLWKEVIRCQIESGGPSILFKDSINRGSKICFLLN
jgi:ribonucleotide reductase alpha subunit